jgi:hypothetical protein
LAGLVGLLALFLVSTALADRIENVSESFPPQGIKSLQIDTDFGLGKLNISAADIEEVGKFDVEYDSRLIKYFLDYAPKGDVGYLEFGTKTRHSTIHGDEVTNDWKVILSNRYPTELSMDIGACEHEIDLGGIPLTEVTLDIGASDGSITFSKKNPVRMENFDLDIGASSVELTDLGNANFDYMSFDCGAASCKVDFFGEWEGSAEVSIDVGVGSAKIVIPRDLEVRIITDPDSWFSSVDFHNDDLEEVRDGVFESEGYRGAKNRLLLNIDVGMGSVDIHFK